MSIGFTDKLFWRQPTKYGGQSHCFKRVHPGPKYQSLCRRWDLDRSGGQRCARPPAMLRCALCDVAEMKRRGWEESGPVSPHWSEYRR